MDFAAALGGVASSGAEFMANRYFMEKQQKFQREMFGNRHQMEVEDLRRAGLNPILSATGNAGSVGSSASASMSKPDNPVIKGMEASALSSFLSAKQQEGQTKEDEERLKGKLIEYKENVFDHLPPAGKFFVAFPGASTAAMGAAGGAGYAGHKLLRAIKASRADKVGSQINSAKKVSHVATKVATAGKHVGDKLLPVAKKNKWWKKPIGGANAVNPLMWLFMLEDMVNEKKWREMPDEKKRYLMN